MKKILIVIALTICSGLSTANEIYREPSVGDRGAYYVLSSEKIESGIIKALVSRIGKGNAYTNFTELKIDCKLKQYFELAGSEEDGAKEKPSSPLKDWSSQSQWTSLVTGSSKSDLVIFICNKYK